MNMQPDNELLRQYASAGSEVAFAELVRRHVNLVYSAALRQVGGDAHLAHDVAQNVFTDLARKAASLCRRESLSGWLYTSAYFAANKIVRTETRRREREEEFMREPTRNTSEADWEKIQPILDAAMHGLKEMDREAVLLRYFENRPYAEVGAKLGVNENTARMRVERALEKLRALLAKRAITTTAALASVISANAVQVAPSALAASLTTTSLAAAGAGTSFALFKFMTLTQLKVGLGAIVVAGAATTMVLQHQTQQQLRGDNESLRQQVAQLKTDNANLSNQVAAISDSSSVANGQSAELLKLRAEVTQLRAMKNPATTAAAPPATNNPSATEKTSIEKTQIALKARFVSVPDRFLQTSAAGWVSAGNGTSVISEEQFERLDKSMEQDDTVHIMSSPQVVTLRGRQARMSVTQPVPFDGTNVNIGSILDVTPYFSPDSSAITLNFATQFTQLTGDPSRPIFETLQASNQVDTFSGQTVALVTKISSAGYLPDASELPNRPGTLLILITPTLIDAAGNRLHTEQASGISSSYPPSADGF